jgi:hypothetical protein
MLKSTTPVRPCGLCFDECGSRCTCPCHLADFVLVCAWCPPPRRGPAPPKFALVSHGICPECQRDVDHQITTLEQQRRPVPPPEIRH